MSSSALVARLPSQGYFYLGLALFEFSSSQLQRFAERYAIGEYVRGASFSRSGRWAAIPKPLLLAAGPACRLQNPAIHPTIGQFVMRIDQLTRAAQEDRTSRPMQECSAT